MRTSLLAAALVVAALFIPNPAIAAMCGPSADVQTVENGTINYFNGHLSKHGKKINATYVMAVVVLGTYAEADVSYAGQASYYWIKKDGTWTFSGTFMPKGWPASVRSKLTAMFNQRSNGSKQCTNPKFVPRGSG